MPAPDYKSDAPCGCNSGRRYSECHGPIFEAPPIKAIPLAQAIYAREWGLNAERYQEQGIYTALAKELAAAGDTYRLLDVGCGLGQGLEALAAVLPASEGRLIVGVDENPACLAIAAERLRIPPGAAALQRIKLEKQLSGFFETRTAKSPLKPSGEIVLINADLMVVDPIFETWLDKVGLFDAITMWFSGVHKARSMTKVAQRVGAKNDADLREALEDRVMELAEKRLRPGGVVQIVQRGAGDMEAERSKLAGALSAALKDYPFDVLGVVGHAYEEPEAEGAMALNSRSFNADGLPRFALSTLLRRREDG